MDKRTKILAGLFGAMIAYGAITKVVYPTWIEPLVTIDDRIAKRQKELDKLEAEVEAVNRARYDYREWAGRTGGFEINNAVTEIRERLNKFLEKHKLADVKVTPTRPRDERKTGLWMASVTVSGSGGLDSLVMFLQDVSELPQVCRIGNASITPSSSRGRDTTINRFNLRVPVEVWAVPQNKMVGRLKVEDLVHPEFFIRHQGRDYASIWESDPFNEYVPMKVKTPPTLAVVKGKKVALEVTVEGGVGPYAYQWSPARGLSLAKTRRPQVDSSKTGREIYTVSVTDTRGNVGKSTISVTISDPPPKPRRVVEGDKPTPRPPPPPPPPGRDISKDGRMQKLIMVMMRESKSERRDEIMVNHARSKQTSFFAAGDQFEGGKLIFVHQTGGLVNWKDEYYVYPLGETLDRFVSANDAFDYPILQRAAGKHMELVEEMAKVEAAKEKAATARATEEKAKTPATKNSVTKPAGNSPPAQNKPASSQAKAAGTQKKATASVLPGKRKKSPTGRSGEAVSRGKKPSPRPSGKKPTPVKPKKRNSGGIPK